MIISNALPIQFWETGTETFNELDVCGINGICFCQPVQCNDELIIQFQDTTGQSVYLVIVDSDGLLLASEVFVEIITGVYSLTIIPSQLDNPICGDVVQFKIASTGASVFVIAPNTPWTNTGSDNYTFGATTLVIGPANNFLASAFQPAAGVDLTSFQDITIQIVVTGTLNGTLTVTFRLIDDSGASRSEALVTTVSGSSTLTLTPNSTVLSGTAGRLEIRSLYDGTNNITVTITVPVGEIIQFSEASELYKSDCIDIAEEHECTKLITYSNNSDFAGIVYDGISPVPEFHLRVPAMLFRATRPEEQEVHPLSNDEWLRVWSRMTKKMRLELGFMPDYMHEKLQLILMHDNVEIDGLSWKKRDPYELGEGNKRNPLMKASVLLTDKTFIKRNLI